MDYTVCRRIQGAGAENAIASLEQFFHAHDALSLQTITAQTAEAPGVKGLFDNGEQLYAIGKEVRDWAAGLATIGAFAMLFLPSPSPSSPVPAEGQLEQVKAVRELLSEIKDLRANHEFTLELVNSKTGDMLRIDHGTAPAAVIDFCQRTQ